MRASPSAVAVEVPIVQSVRVRSPPPTRSASVGVNSRAPRRINTLFCSFMLFSFRHFGSVETTQVRQKRIFAGPPDRSGPLQLALRGTISVSAAQVRIKGARSQRSQAAADALRLLPIELTSTLATQHPVLVIHICSPVS